MPPEQGPALRIGLATTSFLCLYGLVGVPAALHRDDTAVWLPASAVLAPALAWLSAVDLREQRLPDAVTLPLAALGLMRAWLLEPALLWWYAVSAVAALALMLGVAFAYRRLRRRPGLGLGDAKLLAASGAWVGAEGLAGVLLWASGSALAGALIAYARGHAISGATRVPFGPFLAFGTWIVWAYGAV